MLVTNAEALVEELAALKAQGEAAASGAEAEDSMWGKLASFFGGGETERLRREAEAAAAAEAAEAADVLDLTEVNKAIDGAARRMAKLEETFVAAKRSHAVHSSVEYEEALRCAKLEATLADVEDSILRLRGKCYALEGALDTAETELGVPAIMEAREKRQAAIINGGTAVHDAVHAAKIATPPPPPRLAPPPPPQQQQQSFLWNLEEALLSKVAL